MPKNRILPQMFDVRPVDETGGLDWKKIDKLEKILKIEMQELKDKISSSKGILMEDLRKNQKEYQADYYYKKPEFKEPEICFLGEKFPSNKIPVFHKSNLIPRKRYVFKTEEMPEKGEGVPGINPTKEDGFQKSRGTEGPKYINPKKNKSRKREKANNEFIFSDLFLPTKFAFNFNPRRTATYFAAFSLTVAFLIGGFSFGAKGLRIKGKVLGTSQEGYSSLNSAIENIKNQNFKASSLEFESAFEKFSAASEDLDQMGKIFIEVSQFFPFSSKLSSGKNVLEAGKHISAAGKSMNKILETINSIQNPLGGEKNQEVSFLEIFKSTEKEIKSANEELAEVQENLDRINIDDLPEDKREKFASLKKKFPEMLSMTDEFLNNSEIFVDLLGGNGPRKYLFLFQNNQEMRATGGFIGSYGLMDIAEGRIRNFFIDGIFNPDGQLQEKIIPPQPIQKVSAAWSLHDSNWFPDFPTSAKEAILFFEKTGGPTVDGIITLTPTVMQELLKITGPIEMKDYDVTIDSENFIEKTQYQVEEGYDKKENKPKKILSDLAPIILDKIFNSRDIESLTKTIDALSTGLSQKHILLYSENENIQNIISKEGWSGEIIDTPKDYLSVINTNINGYKTDGVINEEISHKAEIQPNGEIIDTITITRHHNGGNTNYEWWNKVNADYLRVYVPLGSKLLEAEGQTREKNNPPLDYEALKFKKDPLVQKEEQNIVIHQETGTRIYEDAGKTVFANWTYVSPQETMVLKYKYLLPFKINFSDSQKPADSYSLLVQKQSGSIGSKFLLEINFPKNYNIIWNYPDNIEKKMGQSFLETDLKIDRFVGMVFTKEGIVNE